MIFPKKKKLKIVLLNSKLICDFFCLIVGLANCGDGLLLSGLPVDDKAYCKFLIPFSFGIKRKIRERFDMVFQKEED